MSEAYLSMAQIKANCATLGEMLKDFRSLIGPTALSALYHSVAHNDRDGLMALEDALGGIEAVTAGKSIVRAKAFVFWACKFGVLQRTKDGTYKNDKKRLEAGEKPDLEAAAKVTFWELSAEKDPEAVSLKDVLKRLDIAGFIAGVTKENGRGVKAEDATAISMVAKLAGEFKAGVERRLQLTSKTEEELKAEAAIIKAELAKREKAQPKAGTETLGSPVAPEMAMAVNA